MTDILIADPGIGEREPPRPWQHPAFGWTLVAAGPVAALLVALWEPLSAMLYQAEFAFAVGYTSLVFAVGVFGGSLVKRLRLRSFAAPRAAAGALLLVAGVGFVISGLAWF